MHTMLNQGLEAAINKAIEVALNAERKKRKDEELHTFADLDLSISANAKDLK